MRQHGLQKLLTYFLGSIAVSLSLYTLFLNRQDFAIVAALIFFILICYSDCRFGKIPNIINLCLLVAGFAINLHIAGAGGLLTSLSGLFLGIALLFLPYLAGGFGAGDVKALGALGALVGPYALLHVFAYTALYGGGLALLYNLFNKQLWQSFDLGRLSITASVSTRNISNINSTENKSKNALVRFPYATAIAFGYISYIHWGGII